MSHQIRAPKARKVNSYNIVKSSNLSNNVVCAPRITDFASFGKRNSDDNIRKFNFMENEEVCFEEIESEFDDHLKKFSFLKEINDIVNQQKKPELSYNAIERCENPFLKNFKNDEKKTISI